MSKKDNIDPYTRASELILHAAKEGIGSNSNDFDMITGVIGFEIWKYIVKGDKIDYAYKYGKHGVATIAAILTRVSGNSTLYKTPILELVNHDNELISILERESIWGYKYIGDNIKISLEQVACDLSVAISNKRFNNAIMSTLFYSENIYKLNP
jgi:hypothetical protein